MDSQRVFSELNRAFLCGNVRSQREILPVLAGIRDEAINSQGYITPPVHDFVLEIVREAKAALSLLDKLEPPPVHGSRANQIVHTDCLDSTLPRLRNVEEGATSEPLSKSIHACRQANVPEYVQIEGAGMSFSGPNQQQQRHYQIEKFGNYIRFSVVQDDGNNNVSTSQAFAQRKPNPNPNLNSNQYMSSKLGRGNEVTGKCAYSEIFSIVAQLTGHTEAVSAVISMGSDKLYSGSKDKSLRVWNPQTEQCTEVFKLEGEVGSMINAGSWILVGIPNTVKAWNTQTNVVISLSAPGGPVYALFAGNGMLFAGMQDGNILVWRFNDASATNCFEEIVSLTGHSLSVVSLAVEANRLYSGSMDKTIRVWDLDTLQCIQTLTEHTSTVTSLLCWKQYLISCSLDQTIKVWVASESGSLEVTYTHKEVHGVLGLCGMHDALANPVLLCSCNDYSVRFYDLPSFNERGKIISMEEIRVIQLATGGLFFTGNGTGELKVWKWSES